MLKYPLLSERTHSYCNSPGKYKPILGKLASEEPGFVGELYKKGLRLWEVGEWLRVHLIQMMLSDLYR